MNYSLRREDFLSVIVKSMVSRRNTMWLNLTDSLGPLTGLRIQRRALAVAVGGVVLTYYVILKRHLHLSAEKEKKRCILQQPVSDLG